MSEALAREYPESIKINLHLAVLDTAEKKYRESEAMYMKMYKPGQQDLRPLEGLIQLYGEERQMEKALKLLEDELKKAPDSRPIHLLLAAADVRAGKLDLAIQQYEWLRSNDPTSMEIYTLLWATCIA